MQRVTRNASGSVGETQGDALVAMEYTLALRILESVERDGRISGLAVPASSLDPRGLHLWIAHVVGDAQLACDLRWSGQSPDTLLARRRREAESVVAAHAARERGTHVV